MAEDQGGQRGNLPPMAWLKLFGAFKVALDPKKLLLAGAGVLVMALGWWFFALVFYGLFAKSAPEVSDYERTEEGWRKFTAARASWNLMNEMSGPSAVPKDAADLAGSLKEYRELVDMVKAFGQFDAKVKLSEDGSSFDVNNEKYPFTADKEAATALEKARLTAGQVKVIDLKSGKVALADVPVTLKDPKQAEGLQKFVDSLRSPSQARLGGSELDKKALAVYQKSIIKPFAQLRTLPWDEYRGPNPYLLVTGDTKVAKTDGLLHWFLTVQVPVMLEPLCKLLEPVKYFLKPAAGLRERFYLLFVILWTILTWALFGGAITRMAAVQVARQNEKVGLVEAVRFARGRLKSFFFAPILPLIFLAIITGLLILFAWFVGFTWILGDIVFGILFPMVMIGGLVMAAILVGLVGWPLMPATISAEGSDSFDALSRSYSYVYQAAWHYIWYGFVAVVYGAALIFFVGFMGSLLVYMGKWGMANAPLPNDREPSYFFAYAPTSFGWRDLLLKQSPAVEVVDRPLPNGDTVKGYGFTKTYEENLSWNNRVGAGLVTFWLWLVFLLIVGFGYSYFWTVATIIYLLLRRRVDDTELDEVHLEEEEEPFTPEAPPPQAPREQATVTMVESPTLRGGAAAPPSAPPPPAAPPPGTAPSDGPSPGGHG